MGRSIRIGLYSPYFGTAYGGGEKYLGVTAEALRDAVPDHSVELLTPVPVDAARYREMLGLNLDGIDLLSANPSDGGLRRRLSSIGRLRPYRNLAVSLQAARLSGRYDLYLSMVYELPAASRARRGVVLCQFPYAMRPKDGFGGVSYRLLKKVLLPQELDSFTNVICQSEYVRQWTRRYWGRDAVVVNPPIDVPDSEPEWDRKGPLILSVGRFVAGGHNKRHDLMVEVFRELCDEGLKGWELHLAGSTHADAASRRYYADVARRARGYPIWLHADVPGSELDLLYARASVYWHAAGFGADPTADPAALEHFGMTTAEAMGHGAVPVAIGLGGQLEVVTERETGFLWNDTSTLKARTLELTGALELRVRLGRAARRRSRGWCRKAFKRSMLALLAPIVHDVEQASP
jgi:glycosyltransferase involved in cell wall biosynthesis